MWSESVDTQLRWILKASTRGLADVRSVTNGHKTEHLEFTPHRGLVETHRAEEDLFRRVWFTERLCYRATS